MQLVFELPDCR